MGERRKGEQASQRQSQEFGLRLQRRRRDLGLTQEAVANTAGLSRTYYGSLEKGVGDRSRNEPANPSMVALIQVAGALDCSVGDLVDGLGGTVEV